VPQRPVAAPPRLTGLVYDRVLGSGGFSDVYLYQQELPRRLVAVKVLAAEETTDESRRAFVAEANLMAQLSAHPYIVTIYNAAVTDDGRPYFVMEYCAGPSLAEQYKRAKFSVVDALRTGVRVSSAVATAHAAGILHRDIKPANVLTNAYGWPALADFGISSAVDTELPAHEAADAVNAPQGATSTGTVGMSIPWCPPELFEEHPQPDVRSDVFSLAATLYTLLAGHTPFEVPGKPNGTVDLIGRIERGTITPLNRTDVPRSLVAVLNKGMAVDRSNRYATAVDFARALQRVEMELSYSPTPIDVPNLIVEQRPDDSQQENGDATRIRQVSTIEAQPEDRPRTPASAAPAAPAAPTPAPAADPTVIRGVTPVDAQPTTAAPAAGSASGSRTADPKRSRITPGDMPAAPAPGSTGAGTPGAPARPLGENTVLRPRVIAEPGATSDADSGQVAGGTGTGGADSDGTRAPRKRWPIWAAAGTAVVLAAAVTAAIVFAPPAQGPAKPTPEASSDIDTVGIPSPVAGAITPNGDATALTFTWSNPDGEDGDRYVWQRTDGPATDPISTPNTEAVIEGVQPGQTVCIEVSINRGGKLSLEPTEMCS
jgi:serine/threonine protein kinase